MKTFKEVYGALNAAETVLGKAMELLLMEDDQASWKLWAQMEQVKAECEQASTFLLGKQKELKEKGFE